MSWLTDLAGRAEDLLTQIDQGTASVIQEQKVKRKSPKKKQHSHRPIGGGKIEPLQSVALNAVVTESAPTANNLGTNTRAFEQRSSGYASSVSSQLSHPAPRFPTKSIMEQQRTNDEEDKLFDEYLNQSSEGGGAHTMSIGSRSRRSSTSSMNSLPAHLFALGQQAKPSNTTGTAALVETSASATTTTTQQPAPLATSASATVPAQQPMVQSEYTFQTANERRTRELETREQDLLKTIQAKDTQVAVLRVQLQELTETLKDKTALSDKLKTERDRLLRDSKDSSQVRDQTVASLQTQLNETSTTLDRERSIAKRDQTEHLAKIERLETDHMNLSKTLTEVQKTMTEERMRVKEFDSQLRLAKYNLEANKNEFDEYKQKAQKILQSKEKIIESLKSGSVSLADSDQMQLAVQLEEITAERDMLKEDIQQVHMQLDAVKSEMQDLESQLASEQRSSLEQQRSLQDQCQTYQMNAAQYREQLEQLKGEYQYVQDELRRQHLEVQNKLHEKDTEIGRLMSQNNARTVPTNDRVELEQRIKHLTENLIYKQTTIETLQTEKNSLALQLERVQNMYEEAQSAAIRATSTAVYMDQSVSSRIPSFLRPTPYDSGVAKGVKAAYSSLDTLSVKVAITLRRYPVARVMLLFYMVLLHMWVMVVLLTYTPEIHGPDYHPTATGGARPVMPETDGK